MLFPPFIITLQGHFDLSHRFIKFMLLMEKKEDILSTLVYIPLILAKMFVFFIMLSNRTCVRVHLMVVSCIGGKSMSIEELFISIH